MSLPLEPPIFVEKKIKNNEQACHYKFPRVVKGIKKRKGD
jgi:hypothetical protein